jgi:N-acetylneuraminic acid mutarotase
LYDITKNKCKELAALPYPVSEMVTVKWGDDSVIIAGGADSNNQALNKVLLYNIKTQKSRMLPDMKYKRKGCVAAVVRDTVIVMGGRDERGNYLKSVECFRFDRYSWQELPEMQEARYLATAVVC